MRFPSIVPNPAPGLVWNEGSDRFYLTTPALGARLDLVKHLIEDSRLFLFVIAARGSGKSALLDEILAMARDGWRVARIQANAMLDPLGLLRDLTDALTPGVRGQDRDALLAALADLLAATSDPGSVPVVLVDDAHELSEEALKLLFSLGQASREAYGLRIVLFCEPGIDQVLKARGLAGASPPVAHRIDVPPFTLEETRAYLAERLSRVGLAALLPLDAGIAERIHREARGLPGAIDVVARETLWRERQAESPLSAAPGTLSSGEARPGADTRSRPGPKRAHHWRLYTVALVLAIVTALFLVETNDDEVSSDPSPSTTEIVPLDEPAGETRPRPGPAEPPAAPPVEAGQPVSPAPAGQASRGSDAPDEKKRGAAGTRAGDSPAAPAGDARERVPTPPAEPVKPGKPPAVAAGALPKVPGPKRRDTTRGADTAGASWLRAQPAGAYVLQLIGSASRDAISRFMARHAFGARAAWVTTKRNGQDWHIVVYGPFGDRTEAHAAIATLPAEVRALRPWARRISDITRALVSRP